MRGTRIVTHCKRDHEFVDGSFRFNKAGSKVCIACAKMLHAEWRIANPQRVSAYHRRARLKRADAIREFDKTPAQRARKAAMKRRLRQDPLWRARERERATIWRRNLPEEVRQASRDKVNSWRRANRERVRELNRLRRARLNGAVGSVYVTAAKLRARRDFYGGRCFYCGSENAPSMDHRIPIIRGGSEFPSNQVPCCKSCNSHKGTRLPREWILAT